MNQSYILSKLAEFKKNRSNKYHIQSIGIFGSVARGEDKDDSDIDVCIKVSTPDIFELVHIKEELKELFKKDIDIIRLRDKMNPYLKKRIEKEAIYV